MTGHSLVPKSAASVGIAYERLCLMLLADARLDTPAQKA
jgi:D-alanine-D-alanine ligase